jgi:hypothetical protein
MSETGIGLSPNDVVNVSVSLTPKAIGKRNFGSLLILGASSVIDVNQRIRQYSGINGVAADFGSTTPEYLAARDFFSQAPQPAICYIGRWAKAATPGILHGGSLSPAQQAALLTTLAAITTGSMEISFDGSSSPVVLSAVSFSGVVTLQGAAGVITAALGTHGSAFWSTSQARLDIISGTTGTTSAVTFASPTGSGTDLSALFNLTAATGASTVAGIAAETPLACATQLANQSNGWYGLMFADTSVTDAQHEAVAAFILAEQPTRIYGITTQEAAALNSTSTTDLPATLQANGQGRTFIQYSSSDPYAVASMFGRFFTVDPTGQNTTLTLKFKSEPGITPENFTEQQAATLTAKNCNVYVEYANGVPIIQQGVMCDGTWIDLRWGADAYQSDLQTAVFNVLYQATTKIPQTDAGVHQLVTACVAVSDQYVRNGFLAPGTWTASLEFGTLHTGDFLPAGYYIYAEPIAQQDASDRDARAAPPIQIAAKQAGAIHSANIAVSINQ